MDGSKGEGEEEPEVLRAGVLRADRAVRDLLRGRPSDCV